MIRKVTQVRSIPALFILLGICCGLAAILAVFPEFTSSPHGRAAAGALMGAGLVAIFVYIVWTLADSSWFSIGYNGPYWKPTLEYSLFAAVLSAAATYAKCPWPWAGFVGAVSTLVLWVALKVIRGK